MKLKATDNTGEDWDILPAGNYSAILMEVEERTGSQMGKEGEMEPSNFLIWKFAIQDDEEYGGRNAWGISSTKLSPKAKARPWVEALLGRSLMTDEEIDPEDLYGAACEVTLAIVPDKKNPGEQRNAVTAVSPVRRGRGGNGGPIPITESVERAGLIRRYEQATSALGWDAKATKLQQLMEGYDDIVAHKLPLDKFTSLVELFEAKAEQADIPFDNPDEKEEELGAMMDAPYRPTQQAATEPDELDAAGLVSASPGKKK